MISPQGALTLVEMAGSSWQLSQGLRAALEYPRVQAA